MNIMHCGWKITELFIARARFINKFHKNTLWTITYVADNAFNVIFFNIFVVNTAFEYIKCRNPAEFPFNSMARWEYRLEFVFLTTINCYLLSSGGEDSFFLLCFILLEPACFYTQK